MTVVIKGLDELNANLAAIGEELAGEILRGAVRSAAMLIEDDAKRLAPYESATLRRSIHIEVEGDETRAEASIGTDVIYAAQVEFGGTITPKNAKLLHWVDKAGQHHFAKSVHQPARPYLRPALDQNVEAATEEIADALRAALKKAIS